MELGIALALMCAVVTQLGFLCKHRGAGSAPLVKLTRPLASARALFASGWFAAGMAIAAGAWILHVAALALAPLSTVQVVLSTGVVILAVLGDRLFGHSVGRRQWAGVAMTAGGLVLLVLTMPTPDGHLAAFAVPGALLGAAAGVLFGVGDVALKALTGAAGDGLLALALSPWLPVAAIAAALAFLASARGFQEGDAVPVIGTS